MTRRYVCRLVVLSVAAMFGCLALGWGWAAASDAWFVMYGDPEALDACMTVPSLDCNPRKGWVFALLSFVCGTASIIGSIVGCRGCAVERNNTERCDGAS